MFDCPHLVWPLLYHGLCLTWQISRYRTQSSVLGKTFITFLTQVAYTAPSSTVKVRQQGEWFLVSSRLIPLCPATKVCSVLSNRVLPNSYRSQPTLSYCLCCYKLVLFGVLIGPPWLIGNSYGSNLCLHWDFHLITHSLLGETLFIHVEYVCSNSFLFKIIFLLAYKWVCFHKMSLYILSIG